MKTFRLWCLWRHKPPHHAQHPSGHGALGAKVQTLSQEPNPWLLGRQGPKSWPTQCPRRLRMSRPLSLQKPPFGPKTPHFVLAICLRHQDLCFSNQRSLKKNHKNNVDFKSKIFLNFSKRKDHHSWALAKTTLSNQYHLKPSFKNLKSLKGVLGTKTQPSTTKFLPKIMLGFTMNENRGDVGENHKLTSNLGIFGGGGGC